MTDVKLRDVISRDVGFNEPTTKCECSSNRACQSNVKSCSYSNAENDTQCGKIIDPYL